ncbi:hypothetical protein [Halopelagius fulvigenes]|uniref:DUF1922 domain-containing protein n=1 Tax=Halopelagius fulvigenes TaxID=1198324 RepID=A0ABD5TYZ9_9EURY
MAVTLSCRNDGATMTKRRAGGFVCPDCGQVAGVRVTVGGDA